MTLWAYGPRIEKTYKAYPSDPNFTDEPIIYSTAEPVKVAVPEGPIKYIAQLGATLRPAPADKIAIINDYVNRAVADSGV